MATPRQPRRPIRRVAAATTPATRGSLALSDPVIASNPYASGANIYPNASSPNAQGVISPNPPVDTVSKSEPPLKNYGATGTSFFGGIIQSDEYNPEFGWRDAVIKYEQMSRNEAQIFAIKQLVEQPMLAANWKIEPASDSPVDQEIASFVQSCLFDDMCYTTSDGTEVYQSWAETLRQILMYKWYGFMLLEKCFRIDDGWVKWSRWLPLLPRTVWRWYVGEDNELESVEQWAYKQWTYQYNRIPRGKLLHFANRMEGQNYQGVSVLRSAFKNWWYKQQFEKIAAIEIERNAIIPPVVKMGEHPSADEVQAALKLAQNVRANELMGVVIGHDMDFNYPRMTERGAAQIMPLIEYHDNMIARNILGQFINLGSHEVGSYALAQTQYTNFLNTLQSDCAYVCDIINHQAIRQLVDYNYDGVAVYPKLTCSRLVAQDITTLSNALQYLGAYVPPSPEVNDAIADALGLPKPPASMVEATNPGAPTTPERPENQRADDHTTDNGSEAQGHSSGTGGGRDGTADYQDTYDNGGAGDGVGMSEQQEQTLREFRLLRESLDAFHAQVSAEDAVERGLTYLFAGGGNPNHIPKGEPGAGQFAPGGAGGHGGSEHEGHSGGGRGRGSRGGGSGGAGGSEHEGHSRSSGSHASKGEHAPKAPKASRSSSTRGKASGKASGKSEEEKTAAKTARSNKAKAERLEAARQRVKDAEERVRATSHPDYQREHGLVAGQGNRRELAKANTALAKLEGRKLHPAEAAYTREEFLQGKAAYHTKSGQMIEVSKEEAHAWLNGGNRAAKGEHEATHTTHAAKSSTRSSSTRGKASGKSEEEKTAAKATRSEQQKAERLEAARQRVKDAEAERRTAFTHDAGIKGIHAHVTNVTDAVMARRNESVDKLVKVQQDLAKLEGRHLHPAERGITREEFLSGHASYVGRRSDGTVGIIHVSKEEAHAWLNGGNKAPFKEPGKTARAAKSAKGEGKLSAKAQMQRDLETIRSARPIREMSHEEARKWNHSGEIDITRTSNPWQTHALFGHAVGSKMVGVMGINELRASAGKMEHYLTSKGVHVSIRGKTRDALAKRINDVVAQHPQEPFDINDF